MGKMTVFIESFWYLFCFYIMLRRKGLPKVIKKMEEEIQTNTKGKRFNETCIVKGFQLACNMHFLNVECLERSLALYKLLSLNNYECRFCLGIRQKPFLSHAWIETNIHELDESKNRDKFYVFLTLPQEEVHELCQ